MVDLELDLARRDSGMTTEGVICTITQQLGIQIETEKEYRYIEPIFGHLRGIAKERIRRIREEGGQWPVFPTGLRTVTPLPQEKPKKRTFPPRYNQQLSLDLPDAEEAWVPFEERNLLSLL